MAEGLVVPAAILLAVVLGGALNWLLRKSAAKFKDDSDRIEAARAVLDIHVAALGAVLDSDAPDLLKKIALLISRGSLERGASEALMDWIEKGSPPVAQDDEVRAIENALDALKVADPKTYKAFIAAAAAASAFTILQWPETAMRAKAFVRLSSEPQAAVLHSSAVAFHRDRHDEDGMGSGGLAAAPA